MAMPFCVLLLPRTRDCIYGNFYLKLWQDKNLKTLRELYYNCFFIVYEYTHRRLI